jgi:peptidoglycan hydrolase-like protein with peptidoglycan-binding domain
MASLRRGDSGGPVADLQQMLIDAGYDVGSGGADGIFGKGTESALLQFQEDHELDVDGLAGPNTIAKLEEVIAEGC